MYNWVCEHRMLLDLLTFSRSLSDAAKVPRPREVVKFELVCQTAVMSMASFGSVLGTARCLQCGLLLPAMAQIGCWFQ